MLCTMREVTLEAFFLVVGGVGFATSILWSWRHAFLRVAFRGFSGGWGWSNVLRQAAERRKPLCRHHITVEEDGGRGTAVDRGISTTAFTVRFASHTEFTASVVFLGKSTTGASAGDAGERKRGSGHRRAECEGEGREFLRRLFGQHSLEASCTLSDSLW